MEKNKLHNLRVVYFESRHSKTMGDLIRVQGGTPVPAPAVKEVPLEDNPAVFNFAEKLLKNEIHAVIFLTGVGTRYLIELLSKRYPKEEILEALKRIPVIPRGPKPVRVLNELGVPFLFTVPEPNTWKELIAAIDQNASQIPLSGRLIAVQEYGVTNDELMDALKKRGADAMRVPIYRWTLPDDIAPLENAVDTIVSGNAEVLMFTTSVQVPHLFEVARKMGKESKLKEAIGRIVVASVGPDCSETLRSFEIPPDIEPKSPKMGPLVQETADRAAVLLKDKKNA